MPGSSCGESSDMFTLSSLYIDWKGVWCQVFSDFYEVRGQEIVLSKRSRWRELEGTAAGSDLMGTFAAFKKQEREREDSRS